MESRLTDLQLAEIDLDALFVHDARGRIVRSNEPDGEAAPRFAFGRTQVGNVWRVGHEVPDDVARRLEALAASEPVSEDLEVMPAHLNEMIHLLGPWDTPFVPDRELSYHFPDEIVPSGIAGVTRITYENLALLRRMVEDVAWPRAGLDAGDICTAMVVDGAAVSMCFCSRLTDRAAEAGVETLEAYRGRGFAPGVVAAWAQLVRDSGRIPFYGTSWDNSASQAAARKLGLVRYAVGLGIE